MSKKSGLGKGLDALFEDNLNESQSGVQTLRLSEVEPNKSQPRQNFDEASIATLADSIRQHGLIQPIVVRETPTGYQIVAGERRWRACRMLGMSEIPVIIKEFDDSQTAQIALIENIQREDLNPIEEASAYKELMEKYDMTQETLSKAVGKSRSVIANSVRLLNMPDEIQTMLKKGELSSGQAKAIGACESDEEMVNIANRAKNGQLTVRAIEKLIAAKNNGDDEDKKQDDRNDPEKKQAMNYLTEMELSLREALGRKVKISSQDGKKGSISIDFFDTDDLSDIAGKLTGE
jgi:ParB family chromosome partitioning protein